MNFQVYRYTMMKEVAPYTHIMIPQVVTIFTPCMEWVTNKVEHWEF